MGHGTTGSFGGASGTSFDIEMIGIAATIAILPPELPIRVANLRASLVSPVPKGQHPGPLLIDKFPDGQATYATGLPYDPIYDQYRATNARYHY